MIELTERRGECDGPVRGGREERNRRWGRIPVAGRGGRAPRHLHLVSTQELGGPE